MVLEKLIKPMPLPKQPKVGPVYQEANNAIEEFLKKPNTVRHQLGRGVPSNSPLLN